MKRETTILTYLKVSPMAASDFEARILAHIDQRMLTLREELQQLVGGFMQDALHTQGIQQDSHVLSNARSDVIVDDALSDTIIRGRTHLRRNGGRILRDVGTKIGNELGDVLFDNTRRDIRLGNNQLGSRVLEGLFKSQRNK
jgi:hypothetical protein